MALHPGLVFRPAFFQRLAAASDLQKLLPAAAANPGAFANGFQVFGVMLLNIPKDRGDFRRAIIKYAFRGLRLGFQRGDFVADPDGVKVPKKRHAIDSGRTRLVDAPQVGGDQSLRRWDFDMRARPAAVRTGFFTNSHCTLLRLSRQQSWRLQTYRFSREVIDRQGLCLRSMRPSPISHGITSWLRLWSKRIADRSGETGNF